MGAAETAAATLPANTWTHLAVAYDGSTIRLYVNGAHVSSVAKTGALMTSANALTIGGDPFYGQFFKGWIDEIRIYNRAIGAAEVQADMNMAVGGTPTTTPSSDTQAPTVSITSPSMTGSYSTSASTVTVSGTASDNVGVTQVTWANGAGGTGTTTGTTTWSASGIGSTAATSPSRTRPRSA